MVEVLIEVGSEEARLHAGLRPPLKLHVRFSRMQLSRRLTASRCNRRNYSNEVDKLELAVEQLLGQPFPASVTPMLEAVRPDTMNNPAIDSVEEQSDMGSFVIFAPPSQERV